VNAAKPAGEFFEGLPVALAMRLDPSFRRNRDDLRRRCKPVWMETVGRLGEVIVHAVERHAEKMLDLLCRTPSVTAVHFMGLALGRSFYS
jgi:hypothetical protein